SQFALTHVNEIVDHLSPHDKWFLFLNARETHYMYDTGNGIPKKIRDYFPALKTAYNLREHTGMEFPSWLGKRLHRLQIEALETLDARLKTLITHLPGEQDILMVICADHGENLGETYLGKPRFGHEIASPHVINVPLLIGTRNGMRPGGFKHGDWPSTL
ncbi:MAG: sulfatase-like hydrolase/transferase, partial [archaeon]|nr:sulfatase-like hydrolase/transferase [archaeon]